MFTTSALINGFKISVPDHLASLVPYPSNEPLEEPEKEFGVTGSLKSPSNKNPLRPPPMAAAAIRRALKRLRGDRDGRADNSRKQLSDMKYIRVNTGFLKKTRDSSEPWAAHSMNCRDQTD